MWSIIWTIFLLALECTNIYVHVGGSEKLQEQILEVLFSGSMYVFCMCSLILALTINNKKVPLIIAKLSEIDELFSTGEYRSQIYNNSRLFIRLQITAMSSCVLPLFLYATYVIHGDFSFRNFDYYFFEVIPVFLNFTVILHFANLVLLLKDKYKYLNSALESSAFIDTNVTNLSDLDTLSLTPIENCVFRMKCLSNGKTDNNISSKRKHLRKLRIIYSQLHDVALLINSNYGITLICATIWMFIGIISGANYVIKMKPISIYLCVILAVTWSSLCVAMMIIMAVSCSLAVNECKRSPVIVQKIMLRDDTDSEVMKELKKMFIQFKVMKIEFSAYGLYRIDLSFLCAILGATVSYLIVSLQL
jgi:hypothetical protein